MIWPTTFEFENMVNPEALFGALRAQLGATDKHPYTVEPSAWAEGVIEIANQPGVGLPAWLIMKVKIGSGICIESHKHINDAGDLVDAENCWNTRKVPITISLDTIYNAKFKIWSLHLDTVRNALISMNEWPQKFTVFAGEILSEPFFVQNDADFEKAYSLA